MLSGSFEPDDADATNDIIRTFLAITQETVLQVSYASHNSETETQHRFNKPGSGRPHGCGGPGWSTTCMRPARVVDQVDRSALHLVDQVCQPQAVGLRAASSRSCW